MCVAVGWYTGAAVSEETSVTVVGELTSNGELSVVRSKYGHELYSLHAVAIVKTIANTAPQRHIWNTCIWRCQMAVDLIIRIVCTIINVVMRVFDE